MPAQTVIMPLVGNITINAPDAMRRIGSKIANDFTNGDIIAINGPIGAGKTTLVKGIVSKFSADDAVSSPTYTIINYYQNSKIYHVDLYRINTIEQMMLSGVSDIIDDNPFLVCIEWFDKFSDYIIPTYIINIELETSTSRNITCIQTNSAN